MQKETGCLDIRYRFKSTESENQKVELDSSKEKLNLVGTTVQQGESYLSLVLIAQDFESRGQGLSAGYRVPACLHPGVEMGIEKKETREINGYQRSVGKPD